MCELLKEFIEISAFDASGSPLVKKKECSDCVLITIDYLKENNDAGFLASLNRITEKK